uniref:LOW QUALITY PROTEIN: caspase-10 n=1 Tax=Castor canadensis TaxID=51338 RepID=A0A8B7UTA8_CASCN|nr:LOW QUALITY PROTEIN: caspase-10 [Castor canadensis]
MASQGQSLGSKSDEDCKESFQEELLSIDSSLGVQNVESLKFLCINLVSKKKLEKCSSASDIFNHLMEEELLCNEDPFILAELLYTTKQNHLLQHLSYTKAQVETLMPTRKKVSLFRNLLFELSEGINSQTLKNMIFLLRERIPKTKMTSLSLLAHLEKQDEIKEDNLTLLEDLCKKVAPHLLKMIENYKRGKGSHDVAHTGDEVVILLP